MNNTEKFWDRMAKHQDKDIERFKQVSIKILENTKKCLNASDVVLDFGCGIGAKTCEIAGNVKKIQGIDISSKAIEIAERKAIDSKINNAVFAQGTIFDERFKKESFDVILAFNILHLVEDKQQAVIRITELLKPGGLFISNTPCLGEKMKFSTKLQFSLFLIASKIGLIPSIKRLGFSEVEELISAGDFVIVENKIFYQELSGIFIAAKKIQKTRD